MRNNSTDKSPATAGKKQARGDIATRFKPGQSGNPKGRPRGSKNAILERALADLQMDWLEHGADAIKDLRERNPAQYVKIVFDMMPREFALDDDTQEGFAGIWAALAKASASKDAIRIELTIVWPILLPLPVPGKPIHFTEMRGVFDWRRVFQ